MDALNFRPRLALVLAMLAIATPFASARGETPTLVAPERISQGYTLILPGILGHNFWDDNVAKGLLAADAPTAIEIHDWTRGAAMLVVNMFDNQRRQREIAAVVEKIVAYQERYSGRPVYLIGHSGGARFVVQTLERLPTGRRVTSAVLLAAPMGRGYDLRLAQSRTERGLHNFHSPYDLPISQVWSAPVGISEGWFVSAAVAGFAQPSQLDERERGDYERMLVEHRFSWNMVGDGHLGGHFGWTSPKFVARHIAPIVGAQEPLAGAREAPRGRVH